jgi:hypothetical protein
MTNLRLLDISDPASPALGSGEFLVLAVLVLALTVLIIGGLVLFLVWRKRHATPGVPVAPTNPALNQSTQ